MHSIRVRIDAIKYKLGKLKAIGIVKTFKYSEFKLLDGILHNETRGLLMVKRICLNQSTNKDSNYTIFFLHFQTQMLVPRK